MNDERQEETGTNANESNGNGSEAVPKMVEVMLIPKSIQRDEAFCCREKEDEATIERYAARFRDYKSALKRNRNPEYPFTPILVWHDRKHKRFVLLGGYHRLDAAKRAGLDRIKAVMFHGSEDDAFTLAMRDNGKHGLPLRSSDRRLVIMKALLRFPDRSLRTIAEDVGCGLTYTHKIAIELYSNGQVERPEKRIGKDGKQHPSKRKKAVKQPSDAGADASTNAPVPDQSSGEVLDEAAKTLPFDPVESMEPAKSLEEKMDNAFAFIGNSLGSLPVERREAYMEKMGTWYSRITTPLQDSLT